jgi:hypothetical protein
MSIIQPQKVKRSQKNQKKNKRLVRALIIVELYARIILNSTLLPAQSLNREGEIKTLNNPQNPLHN